MMIADAVLAFSTHHSEDNSMRRANLGAAFVLTLSAFVALAHGQTWSLPSERLGTGNGGLPLTNPTVVGPSTFVTLFNEETGIHTSSSIQPNDVDELIAYGASGSSVQIDGGIGTSQTTGTATCNTSIGSTDFVPSVDTLITALMGVDNSPGDVIDSAAWANAALVVTRFEVQNNPNHPDVTAGTLEGFLWVFAHQYGDILPPNGGTPLNAGTQLFAEVGGSNLSAIYAGAGGGWFLFGSVSRSATPDPPIQLEDWWPLDSIDQFHDSLEAIAVPSVQPLTAIILDRYQVVDENGNPVFQVISAAGGSGTSNFDWHGDLKAKAWYSTHN